MSKSIQNFPVIITWIQGTEDGKGTDDEFRTYCLINMERAYKLGLTNKNTELTITRIADEVFEQGRHKFGYQTKEDFIQKYEQLFLSHLKKANKLNERGSSGYRQLNKEL